jgi:DNA-binding transcriptional MerR regulator
MSPRNIRAHQARRLLPPPVRAGRVAYYHEGHVQRLETIKALQRQGFNLVAVQAILGARTSEPNADPFVDVLRRLSAERPYLVHALVRHGVVSRAEGGGLTIVRPRVLRSTVDLRRLGIRVGPTFEVLVGVLDQVQSFADELVRSAITRILDMPPDPNHPAADSWEEYDRQAVELAQAMAALLTEAFRVVVERSSQAAVPDSIARRADVDLTLRDAAADATGGIDNG